MTSAEYQAEFDKWVGQGYRLVEISGYAVGSDVRYAAIWEKSAGPAWVARHGLTSAQYQTEFDKWVGQGYRLIEISGYAVGSDVRYAAIWEKSAGPAWVARHGLTGTQYQTEFDKWVGQGYRLVEISGYAVGSDVRYAAIWEKSAGPAWVARHGLTSAQYQGEFDNFYYQGYRLKWVSGYTAAGAPRYAAIWQSEAMSDTDLSLIDAKIQAYMSANAIPGLSIAITKQERLVFAKGYGYADTGTKEQVNPDHLFRIASISKPNTALAIMTLIEAGKLTADQKVFGAGAILGTQYGTKPYNDKVKAITVKHLLQHTSGWVGNDADGDGQPDEDWMFMNSSMSQSELIGWVLDNRPPKNQPGKVYQYLNFGYCLLGRVIEKVSGQQYENYVKTAVHAKCGIQRMQIGGNTQTERRPGEVTYYGSNAYGLNLRRMDAHGGWIATPIDLMRLMARTDGFTVKTDILKAVDETTMFTGSSANPGYGMGWIVSNGFRGHNGAMNGTIGFLVRRDDGFSFAVLANIRPNADQFCFTLKGVLDDIVGSVADWPEYDLF
jgi:CubicO group peptidase (beta-lactamase class C family)